VAGDDGHCQQQAHHRKSSELRALNHFKRITGAKLCAAGRAAKNAEGGFKEPLIKFYSALSIRSGAKAHVGFALHTAVRAEALTYQSCPFKTSTCSEVP
jgi:hypothetical protein